MDNMEPNAMIKAMLEFNNKALIMGRRVGTLLQREIKEGGKSKVEEIQEELKTQVAKHEEEKTVWEKEREGWAVERKRLGSWKVWCLDSEKNMNGRINDLEADNEVLKEKYVSLESELEDLKGHIIQEHINGFNKGLRQATFFCKVVEPTNSKYDVNKDIFYGRLVDEDDLSVEQAKEVPATSGRDPTTEEDVIMQVETDPVIN